MAEYFIYILKNKSGMFYVGLTSDIDKMLEKHRTLSVRSFKANFAFNTLVFLEKWTDPEEAVCRLAYLHSLSRIKKQALIRRNPVQKAPMLELKIKKTA